MDERREIVTRERNLPRYLSDYTEVPGQNKLQTIKNRRKSMRVNLTRKMNIIKEYLKERKDRKLIELACTQLNRAWDKLIENHGEFQALCVDDEKLHQADTWLLESQALVEELICRTVEYGEVKTHISGTVSKAHIEQKAPKIRTERTDDFSITTQLWPSKQKK